MVQAPLSQNPPAWAKSSVQLLPHMPQLTLSLLTFVSQPSRAAFSSAEQSAQPALQLIVHCPATHVGEPCDELHGTPQAPQLDGLLLTSVSQPSRATFSLALQSLQPGSQLVMLHVEPPQPGVPWAELQGDPQLPQLEVSAETSDSQPSAMPFAQSSQPAAHAYWQLPSAQPVLTVWAGALATQSFPQPPQCVTLVFESVSQPSVLCWLRSVLQSLQPESQMCSQAPALQSGAEWLGASSHALPQSPQLATSSPVLVSQPSRAVFSSGLQSDQPGLHAMLHAPPVQAGVP